MINEVGMGSGMGKKEVGSVVEGFMEEVKKWVMEKKENVQLGGLGRLKMKDGGGKSGGKMCKNRRMRIGGEELGRLKG